MPTSRMLLKVFFSRGMDLRERIGRCLSFLVALERQDQRSRISFHINSNLFKHSMLSKKETHW